MSREDDFSGKLGVAFNRWRIAVEAVKEIKDRLNGAECEVRNSATALGKILIPPSYQLKKEMEWFNVWVYGGVLRVREFHSGGFEVEMVEVEK